MEFRAQRFLGCGAANVGARSGTTHALPTQNKAQLGFEYPFIQPLCGPDLFGLWRAVWLGVVLGSRVSEGPVILRGTSRQNEGKPLEW